MNAIGRSSLVVALALGTSCSLVDAVNASIGAPTQKTNAKVVQKKALDKHTGKGRVYNKKNGFSIIPPTGWVPFDEPSGNPFLVFDGPAVDGLRPNLNILSAPDDGTSTEVIVRRQKAILALQLKQWKLIDEGAITVDGKKVYFLNSQFTRQQEDKLYSFQTITYLVRGDNKKWFTITFTSTPKHFSGLKKTFEEVAQTIRTD